MIVVALLSLAGIAGQAEAQDRVYVFGNRHLSFSGMRDVLDALGGSGSGGGGSGGPGSFGNEPTDFTALELRQMKQILDEEYAKQEAERLRLLKAKQDAWLQQCQSDYVQQDEERKQTVQSMNNSCENRNNSDWFNFGDLVAQGGFMQQCYARTEKFSRDRLSIQLLSRADCISKVPKW